MEYYSRAVKCVQFAEPTYLAPFLKRAYEVAEEIKDSFSYQILIILTDG